MNAIPEATGGYRIADAILKHMKIDRTAWSFGSFKDGEKEEAEALSKMSYQKKSAIITFLRESYYGRQATTGRLQRIFEVSEFS